MRITFYEAFVILHAGDGLLEGDAGGDGGSMPEGRSGIEEGF